MSERRTGTLLVPKVVYGTGLTSMTMNDYDKVKGIESHADDPDFDELIDVATKLIRAASIGDQYFIPALMGNDPETTKVRHLLVELADVLRGETDDE